MTSPAAPLPLEPGASFNNYVVDRLLGKGGMGAVYLARDVVLGRQVVVKVILGDAAANPTLLERFRREAQAGARIDSDWVVKVFEVGQAFGSPFIVMEYVDGLPLSGLPAHFGRLAPPISVGLALGVARGLVAAHAAGIVHRDVKPANALLCHDGRVKLADFGVARFLTGVGGAPPPPDLTKPGMIVGTPHYLAPEQAQGLAVDGRTDVYALGVSLFELFTGTHPFRGSNMDVLRLRCLEDPPSAGALVPGLPGSFDAACRALMARDVSSRPTAEAAVALLEGLIANEPHDALSRLIAAPTAATEPAMEAVRVVATYGLEKKAEAELPEVREPRTSPSAAPSAITATGTTTGAAPAPSPVPAMIAIGVVALVVGIVVGRSSATPAPATVSLPTPASAPRASPDEARAAIVTAARSRDPAKVKAARDALARGPAFDRSETILGAATGASELLGVLDARARELAVATTGGPLDELFQALLDGVARSPDARRDLDLRAAAVLLGALEGRPVPRDLFLPREAKGDAADRLRRVLAGLGLEHPKER